MLAFEYVATQLINEYFPPASDYANPLSFFLIFALVFFVFHIVSRVYFSQEISFNKAFNVIGSLIFGFLSWIIIAGLLSVGFLMLPLNDDFFYRHDNKIFLGVHQKFVSNFSQFSDQIGGGKGFDPDTFGDRVESKERLKGHDARLPGLRDHPPPPPEKPATDATSPDKPASAEPPEKESPVEPE